MGLATENSGLQGRHGHGDYVNNAPTDPHDATQKPTLSSASSSASGLYGQAESSFRKDGAAGSSRHPPDSSSLHPSSGSTYAVTGGAQGGNHGAQGETAPNQMRGVSMTQRDWFAGANNYHAAQRNAAKIFRFLRERCAPDRLLGGRVKKWTNDEDIEVNTAFSSRGFSLFRASPSRVPSAM